MTATYRLLAVILFLFACDEATAAKYPQTLSSSSRSSIAGTTASIVLYEPRDSWLFGVPSMVKNDGEMRSLGLVDQSGNVLKIPSEVAEGVLLTGIPDPTYSMADSIQHELAGIGVKVLAEPFQSPTLPATPIPYNLVPRTNIDELFALNGHENLILALQTYSLQISRLSVFNGIWLTYIARMTLIDRRTRTVLLESDCSSFVRHKKKEVTSLVVYLANDKFMLKHDLRESTAQCLKKFSSALHGQ